MTQKLVFLDTETTGLDPDLHQIWEIGLIVRDGDEGDAEYCWMLRPDLRTASPEALAVGGFWERFPDVFDVEEMPDRGAIATDHPDWMWTEKDDPSDPREVAREVARLLAGSVVVGNNPGFDERFLSRWLRAHGWIWSAHYRVVDVMTLAAGVLEPVPAPPYHSHAMARAHGIEPGDYPEHTALGDARMVRDLYDAITGGQA